MEHISPMTFTPFCHTHTHTHTHRAPQGHHKVTASITQHICWLISSRKCQWKAVIYKCVCVAMWNLFTEYGYTSYSLKNKLLKHKHTQHTYTQAHTHMHAHTHTHTLLSSYLKSHYVSLLILLMKEKSRVCRQTQRSSSGRPDSSVTRAATNGCPSACQRKGPEGAMSSRCLLTDRKSVV